MIKHKILSVKRVDDATARVTSEIVTDAVINGYGGGRLTYDVPVERAIEAAKEKVEWKLTSVTNPMVWTPVVEENFEVLEDYLQSLVPEPVGEPVAEPVAEPVGEPVAELEHEEV